jgi:hypothetical protein
MPGLEKRFRLYAGLMHLYPAAYRRRYANEMLQTTADMLEASPTRLGRLAVWCRVAIDLPVNIGRQQLNYAGGVMTTTMPGYIKRSGLTAGLLLTPFFAALAANGLDELLFNRELYHSWLWRGPIIGLWVVWLPLLALLLAVAGYLTFVLGWSASTGRRQPGLRRALDLINVWPLLLTGVAALSILLLVQFHDSVHCWLRSPTSLASHLSQTWQCSTDNQAPLFRIMRHSLTMR